MKKEHKSILINAIIEQLNKKIRDDNKKLCENNLYSEQKKLHGADMFFELAYMDDQAIEKIAKACGL